jgi:hypothetical protein
MFPTMEAKFSSELSIVIHKYKLLSNPHVLDLPLFFHFVSPVLLWSSAGINTAQWNQHES